jgi:mRNA interferase MazF
MEGRPEVRKVPRGTVVTLSLDPTMGSEQRGVRPCVIVSDPDVAGDQRYPLVAVVPLTRTAGEGALYPKLEPGESGIRNVSYALVDQIRSVDKRRIRAVGRCVAPVELEAIDTGLCLFLGLEAPEGNAP